MFCTSIDETEPVERLIGFGSFDKANREYGIRISTWQETMIPASADASHVYDIESAGVYYFVYAKSTRNGKDFGGGNNQIMYFKTEDERQEYINKRIEHERTKRP